MDLSAVTDCLNFSCTIEWNDGKNVTQKVMKKKQKKGDNAGRYVTKTVRLQYWVFLWNSCSSPFLACLSTVGLVVVGVLVSCVMFWFVMTYAIDCRLTTRVSSNSSRPR